MRPNTPEKESIMRKKNAFIIGIIIIGILAGYLLVSNYEIFQEDKNLYFKTAELESKNISPGEETNLFLKVHNPADYKKSFSIQITTQCSKLEISHKDKFATEENGKKYLTIHPDDLAGKGETRKLVFDISGELYPGLTSMTAKIDVEIITENNGKNNQVFNVTIENQK